MDFEEIIKTRYSVRSFSDKPIEPEKLMKILEAGRLAPTGCNLQPQRIYVLQSEEALKKINSVCKCIFGAHTVLMITANEDETWKNPFCDNYNIAEIDCSIVTTQIMLQAWELGIGSCIVGYFDIAKVQEVMNIPKNEKVIALLPMGYPSDDSKPIPMHFKRKNIEEIVKYL